MFDKCEECDGSGFVSYGDDDSGFCSSCREEYLSGLSDGFRSLPPGIGIGDFNAWANLVRQISYRKEYAEGWINAARIKWFEHQD